MSARQPASTVQTSEPSRARPVAASAPASSLSGLPGNQAMQALHRSGAARAKLEIGGVDDPQEREADAVAEKVMRSPDGACCSSCDKGGGCEDDGETVRRSPAAVGRGGGALSGHGESGLRRAVGGGEALPRSLRGFFEPRLGRDLDDVKVHRGPDADRASRSIGARAFALGQNIAFADGQWAPETSSGRRLIAHELAHVAAGHGAVRRRDDESSAGGVPPTPAPDANKPPAQPAAPVAPPPAPSPEVQKSALTRIKEINADVWVVFWQETELERLWNSFGMGLPEVVETNLGEWNSSISHGADLWNTASAKHHQDQFRAAVIAKASGYLKENRGLAENEKAAIGPEANVAPTAKQASEVTARRDSAKRILEAERALAGIRTLWCGYDRTSMYSFGASACHPIANQPANRTLRPTHFKPDQKPAVDSQGDECFKMPTWAEANAMWMRATENIDGEKAKFPSLFAITRDFDEKTISSDNPEATLERSRLKLLASLNELVGNIDATEGRLPGKLSLELFPIHNSLMAAPPWDKGFKSLAAHALVDAHQSDEFWKSMELGGASAALFVLASLASGGLAAVLYGAAAGVSAGVAAKSISEYLILRDASRTNLEKRSELVTSGQANAALFTAVLDTVFAFLDVYQAAQGVAKIARAAAAGGATTKTLEQALKEEASAVGRSTAEIAEKDAPKLAERLKEGGARAVEDAALKKEGYVLEVEIAAEGERHVYRRMRDGTWCRFSQRVCGIPVPNEIAALGEQAAKAIETSKGIVESAAHELPTTISLPLVEAATKSLASKWPALARLRPGAIERVVQAAFKPAESGSGVVLKKEFLSAAKGQLLEEIAAVRVRELLATEGGRSALGLGHLTEKPFFIEGSRIKDFGAQFTDGIIAVDKGTHWEIVAVLEAKAGSFAASGLERSIGGLSKATTSEIVTALMEMRGEAATRSVLASIREANPHVYAEILETGGANLASQAERLKALREPLIEALSHLKDHELKRLRELLRSGEGQIAKDIERSLKDPVFTLTIDGKPVTFKSPTPVAPEIPRPLPQTRRPLAIGATPSDVPLGDMSKTLEQQGYDLRALPMTDAHGTPSDLAIDRETLNKLAGGIVNDLGPALQKASEAAAMGPPAPIP